MTLAAGYMAFVGVDAETYGQFVSTTVNILVPIILLLIPQIWGYLQKRWAFYMFKYALHSPPATTEAEVKEMVANKQPPPVEA